MIEKGISIIVCCYNSAQRLPQTLNFLKEQKVSMDIPIEIIIVNNASTDTTKETAKNEWSKLNTSLPLIIIDQPIPGLIAARQKGIDTASYDYLIFCDDDNYLASDYAQLSFNIMEEHKDVAILGGHAYGIFEDENFPVNFKPFLGALAIGEQSPISGYVEKPLYGAGMVIRKSMLLQLYNQGFKSLLFGRKGTQLSSGEDTELCLAFLIWGFKLYYDNRLKLKHYMPKSRLNKKYLYKLCEGGIPSHAILFLYRHFYKYPTPYNFLSIYILLIKNYLYHSIYYFPRMIVGKHKFYSRFSLIQNLKTIIFALTNINHIYSAYKELYKNTRTTRL